MAGNAIRLIAGLGNPGQQYARTRHNAGFWLLDRIAESYRVAFRAEAKYKGELAKTVIAEHEVWLLKPMTFMNRSGESIAPLAKFYKIPPQSILVAHDELDLPAGAVRLKRGGGHGGHNGLRHTIRWLGGGDFARLRLGIGHPGFAPEVVSYVLRSAPAGEQRLLEEAIDAVLAELPRIVAGDWEKVMTTLHSRKPGTG